ncbi:MAG: hypothetical protein KatS3mg034_0016 [Vicingaceae bacterium]|nr:MAG: hypothetical protein KatS3mg034_0016 [Vicingaceae bacterium]
MLDFNVYVKRIIAETISDEKLDFYDSFFTA